jgi:magnesium transporter
MADERAPLNPEQGPGSEGSAPWITEITAAIVVLLEADASEAAAETLQSLRHADQAALLGNLTPGERSLLIRVLDSDVISVIVQNMNPEDAAEITEFLASAHIGDALNQVSTETADSVLQAMPDEEALNARIAGITAAVTMLLEADAKDAAAHALVMLHPVDQAAVVGQLDDTLRPLLIRALSSEMTSRILEELDPEDAVAITAFLSPFDVADVLELLSPDIAADVLHAMPHDKAQSALEAMANSTDVAPLMEYPDDVAGGLMTTKYVAVLAGTTPAVALDGLRLIDEEHGDVPTVFVVDLDRRLLGWVSLRRLALARPHQIARELMEPAVSVSTFVDQEACARLVARYDLSQLPVIGEEGVLVGVIRADDLTDVAAEEATEDMFRMAGMQGERVLGSFGRSVRTRLPWLTVNLLTTFAAAGVVALFESTIERLAVLAVFLPVVAGQGGIGGTQTLTLVVRGIALGELTGRTARRLLIRETLLGGIHGLILAVLAGVVGLAWVGSPILALVLACAMFGNMLVAGMVGAGVPLLLRTLRQDPAVSSAVVVTTATDVAGFFLFLGLASLLIEQLI